MRPIDGHALMESLQKATSNAIKLDFAKGLLEAQRLTINAPTIDAVEVVRCRECKHNPWKLTKTTECVWDDDWAEREQTLDDFCSYGVREDGEA